MLFAVASTLLSVAIMSAIAKKETVRVDSNIQERYIIIEGVKLDNQ